MSLFPDTPKTLLDELALDKEMDEAKWRRFDEMYRPVVTAFIVQRFPTAAHEAEDVAQETMARLSAAIRERRYEAERGRFRTFLGAIASNLVVDILRRHARYANLPFETVDWVSPSSADAPALALLDRQWKEAVYRAARRHVLMQRSLLEDEPSPEGSCLVLVEQHGHVRPAAGERAYLVGAAVLEAESSQPVDELPVLGLYAVPLHAITPPARMRLTAFSARLLAETIIFRSSRSLLLHPAM